MQTSKKWRYISLPVAGLLALVALGIWKRKQPPDMHSEPQTAAETTVHPTAELRAKNKVDTAARESASTYERANNLLTLVEGVEGRTDEPSLTLRARAFEECRMLATVPTYFAAVDTDGQATYGDKLPIVKKYVAAYESRCGDLAQIKGARVAATMQAIHDAADAGSPWAKATLLATETRGLPPAEADTRLEEVFASKDPDAVGAVADMMARPREDSRYSSLAGTPLHMYAWQLASCDLGRDCSFNGALMRQACIFGGACGGASNYRDFLRESVLTLDDFSRVEALEQSALNAVRTGAH